MRSEILSKLEIELKKDFESEMQVVYILSRIRKLLEINGEKNTYPILNFYSNWCLHAEITKTDNEAINHILREFIEKPEARVLLGFHRQFREELIQFLGDHNLPALSINQFSDLTYLLGKVISDTPIEVTIGTRYKIVFKEPKNKNESGLHITTIVSG